MTTLLILIVVYAVLVLVWEIGEPVLYLAIEKYYDNRIAQYERELQFDHLIEEQDKNMKEVERSLNELR